MRQRELTLSALAALALFVLFADASQATPDYAVKTGEDCVMCHESEEGGKLNEIGVSFQASGYHWPVEDTYKPILHISGSPKAILGFVHFVFGFLWFGTILYVHILLRPAYASKGLPRGEVTVGIVSMILVGLSGIALTFSVIHDASVLVKTKWGVLLSVKIALYLIMVSSAIFVVTCLGPRLRKSREKAKRPGGQVFGPKSLSTFDGKEGVPAYVAYKGKVYDVSSSRLWKKGEHFRKHIAGNDLTSAMGGAPHDADILERMDEVGRYDPALQSSLTPPQRLFYIVAYTNLGLVFFVLLVIAFWRWGV